MYSFDEFCRDCGEEILVSSAYGRVAMREFEAMSSAGKRALEAKVAAHKPKAGPLSRP